MKEVPPLRAAKLRCVGRDTWTLIRPDGSIAFAGFTRKSEAEAFIPKGLEVMARNAQAVAS